MKPEISFERLQLLSKPDLLRVFAFTGALWGPAYAPVLWLQGLQPMAVVCLLAAVAVALVGWYQKHTQSTLVTGNLLVAILYVSIGLVAYSYRGDLLSPWFITIPMLATMLGTPRSGAVWTGFTLLHVTVLEPLGILRPPFRTLLSNRREHVVETLGVLGVVLFVLSIVILYERFRVRVMADLEEKNEALRLAMDEVRWLQDLLPICMHCRRVRDEGADWRRLDEYLDAHSELRFSHGLCEDCRQLHYPGLTPSEPIAPADSQHLAAATDDC